MVVEPEYDCEDMYRAYEDEKSSSDTNLIIRLASHCQSLIDIIDEVQGRCSNPVDEEDMAMVRHIAAAAQVALSTSTNTATHCGGCGEADPGKRCIGCMHSFFGGDWPSRYLESDDQAAERSRRIANSD